MRPDAHPHVMDETHDPTLRTETTFTAHGHAYYRLSFSPADASRARARLAVVHGYGDHAGRYAEVMSWLAARGVACHAFDLRGHGRSSGRRAYVRRWDEYVDDLGASLALPELAPAPNAPPLFVLGHSHGGLVVALAGIRKRLDPQQVAGCILSAPYFVNALPVPGYKLAVARVANVVCPWLRVGSGIEPGMMSRDAAMVEDSRRDPLLLRCATPRWFFTGRVAQAEALARAGDFSLPLLVLQGDADPVADPRGAAAFRAGAGARDKSLLVYPGFRHELLRETGRERVFADVLAWVEARARPRAPAPPVTSSR